MEKQLFAGFITALISFTKQKFSDSNILQKISYHNGLYEIRPVENIIVVISFNTTFLSEQKLDQIVNTLINEISQIIQTQDELFQLRIGQVKNSVLLSVNEYQSIFDKLLDKVLQDICIIQGQLVMIEILPLIQIFEDLQILFEQLQLSTKLTEYSQSLSPSSKSILINIEKLKDESISNLYAIQNEFKQVIQKIIKSIKPNELLLKGDNEIYRRLFLFIKKNYGITGCIGIKNLLLKFKRKDLSQESKVGSQNFSISSF